MVPASQARSLRAVPIAQHTHTVIQLGPSSSTGLLVRMDERGMSRPNTTSRHVHVHQPTSISPPTGGLEDSFNTLLQILAKKCY